MEEQICLWQLNQERSTNAIVFKKNYLKIDICVNVVDEQKLTQWTPWSNINQTASGYWVQRYRFACTASVPDPKLIKTSHVKTHTRFCTNSTCYKPGEISNGSQIDTKSPLDRAVRKFCKHRRKLFNKFCNCRTLGVFLICTKCSRYG